MKVSEGIAHSSDHSFIRGVENRNGHFFTICGRTRGHGVVAAVWANDKRAGVAVPHLINESLSLYIVQVVVFRSVFSAYSPSQGKKVYCTWVYNVSGPWEILIARGKAAQSQRCCGLHLTM